MTDGWMEVGRAGEIPPGKMRRIEFAGKRYLIANINGAHYAVDDQCSHEDVPLYLGCIQGDMIKCSLHGSRFSLITGQAMEEPASEPIGTYAVKCERERLFINPGLPGAGKASQ